MNIPKITNNNLMARNSIKPLKTQVEIDRVTQNKSEMSDITSNNQFCGYPLSTKTGDMKPSELKILSLKNECRTSIKELNRHKLRKVLPAPRTLVPSNKAKGGVSSESIL